MTVRPTSKLTANRLARLGFVSAMRRLQSFSKVLEKRVRSGESSAEKAVSATDRAKEDFVIILLATASDIGQSATKSLGYDP